MIDDQPPPTHRPDLTPTWELVIQDVISMFATSPGLRIRDTVRDEMIADMVSRDKAGRERYGTPLTPGNGRDHLVDAYQEALDLSVYLRNELAERNADARGTGPIEYLYWDAIMLAVRLRDVISHRDKPVAAPEVIL